MPAKAILQPELNVHSEQLGCPPKAKPFRMAKMVRVIAGLISEAGKPITFVEMRASILADAGINDPTTRLRPALERSLRRALHRLCQQGFLIALGAGGRGEPHRYYWDPEIADVIEPEPEPKQLAACTKPPAKRTHKPRRS